GAGTLEATADIPGADGLLAVVGVSTNSGDHIGGVGTPIVGNAGTLTVNADGTFVYAAPGALPGAFDIFTYTIQDGDGTLFSTTVTFNVPAGASSQDLHVTAGTDLGGDDVFKGGAGEDTLAGGKGSDTLTGGAGADHLKYISTSDGGMFANPLGADHIVDFNAAQGDVIDILGAAFGNLAPGTSMAAIFGSSAGDAFGSSAERFHYNTEAHTLLYDSNGSDAGGVQATLAVFDNHAIVAATNIHVI